MIYILIHTRINHQTLEERIRKKCSFTVYISVVGVFPLLSHCRTTLNTNTNVEKQRYHMPPRDSMFGSSDY